MKVTKKNLEGAGMRFRTSYSVDWNVRYKGKIDSHCREDFKTRQEAEEFILELEAEKDTVKGSATIQEDEDMYFG